MQIIKQTDEEKMAMYMKMPKKKIAEMLIQCNKVLDTQYGAKVFSPNGIRLGEGRLLTENYNTKN